VAKEMFIDSSDVVNQRTSDYYVVYEVRKNALLKATPEH
jgi:hypothetical protein